MPYIFPNPNYHRNGSPNKSQWDNSISLIMEEDLFDSACRNKCVGPNEGFGIIPDGRGSLVLLGRSAAIHSQQNDLKIAKFVMNQNDWHGYPIDHRQDKIIDYVLLRWYEANYISKPKMAKIKRGMNCNL